MPRNHWCSRTFGYTCCLFKRVKAKTIFSPSSECLQSNVKQPGVISITIKENVRGVIYNKLRMTDYFDYTGSAILSSTLPVKTDISLTFGSTHDIAELVPAPKLGSLDNSDNSIQLFLTPGYDTTELFKYKFEQIKPPVTGTYKVTNSKPGLQFSIELQFYLEQKLTFDYIEVSLPFPNRGPITSMTYEPLDNDVTLNKTRNQISWRLVKPYLTESISLQGKLLFDWKLAKLDNHPLLVDTNAYVDVAFRCSSTTISKMRLLSESVLVFPAVKFKLNYDAKSSGSVVKIWNSSGEVLE